VGDATVKLVADFLRRFSAFRSIDMRNTGRMKAPEKGYLELAQALKINKSLEFLDIRGTHLSEEACKQMMHCLSENYVICEIKLDIRVQRLTTKFTTYPVHSMYEFYLDKPDENQTYS